MGSSKVLVTGGNGFVGTNLQKFLPHAIYLSHKEWDLTKEADVVAVFELYKPLVVVHLAAKVGNVLENLEFPTKFLTDNILMDSLILKHAHKSGVKQFIGILTDSIYPKLDIDIQFSTEDLIFNSLPETSPRFFYSYAKQCLAFQIKAFNQEFGTKYQFLVPCSMYGPGMTHKNHTFISDLFLKIQKAQTKTNSNNSNKITLYGTGKPKRQFLHVEDLCYVIKYCIESGVYESFNVAPERSESIDDIVKKTLKALDLSINVEYDISKPDGQMLRQISIERLKTLIPNFIPRSYKP